MNENTMNAVIMIAFLGAIALAVIAGATAWAFVERSRERTKQLRLRQGGEDE